MDVRNTRTLEVVILVRSRSRDGARNEREAPGVLMSIDGIHPFVAQAYLALVTRSTPNLN